MVSINETIHNYYSNEENIKWISNFTYIVVDRFFVVQKRPYDVILICSNEEKKKRNKGHDVIR